MKNKSYLKIIAIVIIIFIIIVGSIVMINIKQTPRKMFEGFIDKTINGADEIASESSYSSISGDLEVKLSGSDFDESFENIGNSELLKNTINSSKVSYQIISDENNNEYLNVKLKTDKYDLLDVSALSDYDENAVYFNLGTNIYDKNIKLELDEENEVKKVFESDECRKIALNTISNEIKKMLKDENFETEKIDGYKIDTYKTTFNSISANINTAIESLKENQEFLDCFKNTENAIDILNAIVNLTSEEEISKKTDINIAFSMYSKGIVKKVEKILIVIDKNDEETDENEKFEMSIEGIDTENVKITIKGIDNYTATYNIQRIKENSYNTIYTMSDGNNLNVEISLSVKCENNAEIPEFDTENYIMAEDIESDTNIINEIVDNIKGTDIMKFMDEVLEISSSDLDFLKSLYLMGYDVGSENSSNDNYYENILE